MLITLNEQLAFQRGKPFVEPNIIQFEGIKDEDFISMTYEMFIIKTMNPLFKELKFGNKIIIKFVADTIILPLMLKYNETIYKINCSILIEPNKFYILQLGENDLFEILDMEDYTTNPMYYGYYSVDRSINSAIQFCEQYIGYHLAYEHIILTDSDDDQIKFFKYLRTEKVTNIVNNENTIEFDIGFKVIPSDLKQAIMSCANSFYGQYGDLKTTLTPATRKSFAYDDFTKNIFFKYKKDFI